MARRLEDLYKEIRPLVAHEECGGGFICNNIDYAVNEMFMTRGEANKLMRHFTKNKPTKELHRVFYFHPAYKQSSSDGGAWWHFRELGQRLEFLDKMIKITSKY